MGRLPGDMRGARAVCGLRLSTPSTASEKTRNRDLLFLVRFGHLVGGRPSAVGTVVGGRLGGPGGGVAVRS